MTDKITLFEMAPRDGLQNEAGIIPTADKIKLVDLLSLTGLPKIEVASFVSPKWVPQMADGAEVLDGITRHPHVAYTALAPNMRGLDNAQKSNVDEVAVFASASEGFSQANINCSVAESLDRFAPMMSAAQVPVRGYVSCVTDCPYDGRVAPDSVMKVVKALLDMGCYEVSLGDTIGAATPDTIDAMLSAVLKVAPASKLAGHYHDTAGRALENITVSLERGLRTYDASVGGLGGCPYAPGAAGNVATEAVVSHLHSLGFSTSIDVTALEVAADFAQSLRQGEKS